MNKPALNSKWRNLANETLTVVEVDEDVEIVICQYEDGAEEEVDLFEWAEEVEEGNILPFLRN